MKKLKGIIALSLVAISGLCFTNLNVQAEELNSEKIIVNREVTKLDKDKFKVKTVSYVNDENKTDVIIVFNQSKSMNTNDVQGEDTYVPANETNISCFRRQSNLYVLDEGEFYKLTVERIKFNSSYRYRYYVKDGPNLSVCITGSNNPTPSTLAIYRLNKTTSTRLEKSRQVAKQIIDGLGDNCRVAVIGMSNEDNTGLYVDEYIKKGRSELTESDYEKAFLTKDKASNLVETMGITKHHKKDFAQTYSIAKELFDKKSVNNNQVLITVSDNNLMATDEFDESDFNEQLNTLKANRYFKSIVLNTNKISENNLLDKISSNYGNNKVDSKYMLKMTDSNVISSAKEIINSQNRLAQYNNISYLSDELTDKFTVNKNSIKAYLIDNNNNKYKINSKNLQVTDESVKLKNLKLGDNIDKKVVLEYEIQENPNFLGGNNVQTHESSSGLYDLDDKKIKPFNTTYQDVDISDFDFNTISLNDVSEYDVQDLLNCNLDKMDNSEAKIIFTIADDKEIVATCVIYPSEKTPQWNINKDNFKTSKEFTIKCVIEPIEDGAVGKKTITKTSKVKVKDKVNEDLEKPTVPTTEPEEPTVPTTKPKESTISTTKPKATTDTTLKEKQIYEGQETITKKLENDKSNSSNNLKKKSKAKIKSPPKTCVTKSQDDKKETINNKDDKINGKDLFIKNIRKNNYSPIVISCLISGVFLIIIAIIRYKKALA